jgi:hypothetical protein
MFTIIIGKINVNKDSEQVDNECETACLNIRVEHKRKIETTGIS